MNDAILRVRVPSALKQRIEKAAGADDTKKSEFVRKAIEDALVRLELPPQANLASQLLQVFAASGGQGVTIEIRKSEDQRQ
jgi:predicted transcriptional regulator